MDEFSFIDSIKQNFYHQSGLIKGIGDDAAVLRETSRDIVTAADIFVEDVHFTKETMNAFQIGYRALAANLSDLAAMGAAPAYYLVSIVIPKSWSIDEITQIFSGMKDLAGKYKMDLIGGDTVSGEALTISITVIGLAEKEKTRYRNAAREGDVVFVTGTLGDSQAGLHILTNPGDYLEEEYFINRHQMPTPRVKFAKALVKLPRVALNDISDGIASEAAEIAAASNVNITLYDEKIPVSPSYHQFPSDLQNKWKYYGGEDFELMGTISKRYWEQLKLAAELANTKVTEIGYVTINKYSGTIFQEKNNKKQKLEKKGYNHLK
ncbi:thiamine-phosphate kinase [Virgibacillus indicus]|uniref:Thiamine-monophosphate kinase n=1 Tax=Virgibacillus indicus TaxID=2024554 RepID=A0A265N6A0_9BACI|nr:thiamine-phosphate kinase [Virgibacillus indicus]OZU87377.1 thiamine-phosphate kinase [Virgibacillus indicus]